MPPEPQWEDFYFSSRDDLRLYARKYGWTDCSRPTVVCLPGLTRNCDEFHEIATYLSTQEKHPFRVVCMDYRGRGNSEYDKNWNNYNPIIESEDVIAGLAALGVGEVSIIGTSRGGLIAMLLAASKPGLIHSVVLNDVGPEIDGKGLVRIKSYMERSTPPLSRADAINNLKTYSSAHFPNMGDDYWDKQVDLIYKQDGGKFQQRYDRKLINTLKAINLDAPLVALWPQFAGLKSVPVMLLRGENSDLLSSETVKKMQEVHTGMKFMEVPGQGHAPDIGTAGIPQKILNFLQASHG